MCSVVANVTLKGINLTHYDDVIMSTIASQITSLTIVYSTVYSDADQRKHQSSASLALVGELTGEFPVQMASNAENVSIWWRHHVIRVCPTFWFACVTVCSIYRGKIKPDTDKGTASKKMQLFEPPKTSKWPLLLTRFYFNPSMDR